jgi:hypothetical protein
MVKVSYYQLLKFIVTILPDRIVHLAYKFVLWGLQIIARLFGCQLWARNSFLTDAFVPGISDLDISIIYYDNRVYMLENIYKFLKKIIPILGEVNWYDKKVIDKMDFFNFYEISRDPILKKKFFTRQSVVIEEKIIFILKMMSYNMTKNFQINKWKSYCEILGLSPKEYFSSQDDIFKWLVQYGGFNIVDLQSFFVHHKYNQILLSYLTPVDMWMHAKLHSINNRLLRSALCWEIMAMVTRLPDHSKSEKHIDRIFRIGTEFQICLDELDILRMHYA